MAAVDLPGTTSDFIRVASNLGITAAPLNFTIALWIRFDATGVRCFWDHRNNTSRINVYAYYRNDIGGVNRLYIEYTRAGVGSNAISVAQDLILDRWYFIAVTSNGTTMRLYLDNTELGNVALTSGNGTDALTDRFNVGLQDTANPTDGKVAHVIVYNEALSLARLEHLRWHRPPDNDPGLVLYWPLDERAGTIARDHAGNDHDGTLNGNATWVSEHPPTPYLK